MSTPPAARTRGSGRGSWQCARCGKPAFSSQDGAQRAIERHLARFRSLGLVRAGEVPAYLTAVSTYRCDDTGPWHTTGTPLLPFYLPIPNGPTFDPGVAIVEAIGEQGAGLLFPTIAEVAGYYGVDEATVRRFRRSLTRQRRLLYDDSVGGYRTGQRPAGGWAPFDYDVPEMRPLLPLPYRVDFRTDQLPALLLDTILRHPVDVRLPSAARIGAHFGVHEQHVMRIRRALADLGWLRARDGVYLTARPAGEPG